MKQRDKTKNNLQEQELANKLDCLQISLFSSVAYRFTVKETQRNYDVGSVVRLLLWPATHSFLGLLSVLRNAL